MNQIGIFAGTFDPIHKGHISFCQTAADASNLDKVYLLPEKHPRTKQGVTDVAQRIELINHALQGQDRLKLLVLDDDQFTVEKTLPELQDRFPHTKLSLLIGSDVVCGSLPYWENLGELLARVDLVVGIRSTHSQQDVETVLQQLTASYGGFTYTIIDSPHATISSSQIRKNANQSDLQPLV